LNKNLMRDRTSSNLNRNCRTPRRGSLPTVRSRRLRRRPLALPPTVAKAQDRRNHSILFSYFAYGLGIHSTLPLPELVEAEAPPDLSIRTGRIACTLDQVSPLGTRYHAAPDEIAWLYPDTGTLLVRQGREIVFDPLPNVDERAMRLLILGPGLAFALHQRGLHVLHASVVALNGGAVAFLGAPGWGKSTLAFALHARGHPVVADDYVGVEWHQAVPLVQPGFPQLKLWPEALSGLGADPERLPPLSAQLSKRAQRVAHFDALPLVLKRIFVLCEAAAPSIERLAAQEAFVELVRHSYVVHFLRATGASAEHLRQTARLADTVPVARLRRPRSFGALPQLAALVEQDLA